MKYLSCPQNFFSFCFHSKCECLGRQNKGGMGGGEVLLNSVILRIKLSDIFKLRFKFNNFK